MEPGTLVLVLPEPLEPIGCRAVYLTVVPGAVAKHVAVDKEGKPAASPARATMRR